MLHRFAGVIAAAFALAAVSPAQAAVLAFTGTGTFGSAGTPFTVSFSWDTSVRPTLGTQPGPGGSEPAPQFTTNPLRSPLTVTGSFGSFSYADPQFVTRYDNGQVRYSIEANTFPPSQALRIVSVTITAPAPADPYATDLPSDLTGFPATFSFFDDRAGPALDGGNAAFGRGVAAVPEPASWALMLTGMAGIGAMLRRRRRPILQPAMTKRITPGGGAR